MFRTFVISAASAAVRESFARNYATIIQGSYSGELVKDSDAAALVRACKQAGAELVYGVGEVPLVEVQGREVLGDLLRLLVEGVQTAEGREPRGKFARRIYNLMSRNYRRVFERTWENSEHLPRDYLRLQLVTDYVAGMTDTFACTLRRRLIGE